MILFFSIIEETKRMICILRFSYYLLEDNKVHLTKKSKLTVVSSIHIFLYSNSNDIIKYLENIYNKSSSFYFKSSYEILSIVRGNQVVASMIFNNLKSRRVVKFNKEVVCFKNIGIIEYKENIEFDYLITKNNLSDLNNILLKKLTQLNNYVNMINAKLMSAYSVHINRTKKIEESITKEILTADLYEIINNFEYQLIESKDLILTYTL